jgi:hypothetical protein
LPNPFPEQRKHCSKFPDNKQKEEVPIHFLFLLSGTLKAENNAAFLEERVENMITQAQEPGRCP